MASFNYTTRLPATQASNIIEVWEPEDFGPLNGNSRYDIDSAAKYVLKNSVVISNEFEIPEAGICQIVAENRFLHQLTYVGLDTLLQMGGTRIQLLILDNLTLNTSDRDWETQIH